jgi:hypothetical protein
MRIPQAQVPLERVASALEQLAPLATKLHLDLSILYPERTDVPGISSLSLSLRLYTSRKLKTAQATEKPPVPSELLEMESFLF